MSRSYIGHDLQAGLSKNLILLTSPEFHHSLTESNFKTSIGLIKFVLSANEQLQYSPFTFIYAESFDDSQLSQHCDNSERPSLFTVYMTFTAEQLSNPKLMLLSRQYLTTFSYILLEILQSIVFARPHGFILSNTTDFNPSTLLSAMS